MSFAVTPSWRAPRPIALSLTEFKKKKSLYTDTTNGSSTWRLSVPIKELEKGKQIMELVERRGVLA
jgi:hypothetical protein